MSRTTNPNQEEITSVIELTATRLRHPDQEGDHFRELWRFLNTIQRFRALDEEDQVLFFRLALTASDGATRNGYKTYTRAVLQSLEILDRFPGQYSGVRALFSDASFYEKVGVWDTTPAKRNGRIAAVKKYLEAALKLDLIDVNHLDDLATRKLESTPTPASEAAVTHAVDSAIDLITNRVGWWKILAVRNLVLLDWKSYGPRSFELEWVTREDFLSNPDQVPIRVSKTERGKRTLILSEGTRMLTLAYLALYDSYQKEKGRDAPTGSDSLFMGMRGQRLSSSAISSAVSSLLPDNVRPHDLRARVGTRIGQLRSRSDIAVALGILPGSVDAYVAAGDAYGIGADVAELHALAGAADEILESLGIGHVVSDEAGGDVSHDEDLEAGSNPGHAELPAAERHEPRRRRRPCTAAACRSRRDPGPLSPPRETHRT